MLRPRMNVKGPIVHLQSTRTGAVQRIYCLKAVLQAQHGSRGGVCMLSLMQQAERTLKRQSSWTSSLLPSLLPESSEVRVRAWLDPYERRHDASPSSAVSKLTPSSELCERTTLSGMGGRDGNCTAGLSCARRQSKPAGCRLLCKEAAHQGACSLLTAHR